MDPTLKLAISQDVHLAPQVSHSPLLLSAIKFEPSQTPVLLAETQVPVLVK